MARRRSPPPPPAAASRGTAGQAAPRRRSPSLAHAAVAGALACAPGPARAGAVPDLRLSVEEGERILFDHRRDACETWDIPDTPSRAYRDAEGQVRLFQTHYRNRVLVGADLGSLKHDCAIAFEGGDRPDPASFDHRGWIAGTHTLDGRTVYGLVHDEFHGGPADACPPGDAMACWYNSLTAVVSHDGGQHFAPMEPRLVAALPLRAAQTRGGHAGYFEPTNIVAWQGAFYAMANVVSPPPQRSGNCLLRTTRLDDPGSWRVWRDGRFATRLADPYAGPLDVEAHLCDPVAPAALPWPVTSLTRHEASGVWIATMKGRRSDADGVSRPGIYVSTSRDLIAWNGPALLMEAPLFGDGSCAPDRPIAYPALIDPASTDRNFTTLSDNPTLTFVRASLDGCELGPARDIVMKPIRIEAGAAD